MSVKKRLFCANGDFHPTFPQIHADFVNFHAPMRWMNVMNPMIRDDRVHPIEPGHVLMARLFLAAQGLTGEDIQVIDTEKDSITLIMPARIA